MLKKIALGSITIYQKFIGQAMPRCCRFSPSCSEYAYQAVEKYGFFWGSLKAAKRILHCHPFSGKAGYDPLT